MSKSHNIIIISNEPWGDIWFSKHHYASELSKTKKVIFINPPRKWKIGNLWDRKINLEKVSDSLFILNYKNFLPFRFMKLNNRIVSKRILAYLNKINFKVEIFWSFDPQRLFEPQLFKVSKAIFHVVDKYQFKHPAEMIFHTRVNGFVLVSDEFFSQYEKYNKPQLVVPHGLSSDEFEISRKPDFDIPYSDFILFVGNVDLRLDYKFIYEMARYFPKETFLFVGGYKIVENDFQRRLFVEKELKNVIYLPPVHAKNVKYYIHESKCCIAPMLKDLAGNLISHHKILQYMAHGKPVFSPVFSAYLGFSDLLYMDDDDQRLLQKMSEYLNAGEKEHLKDERIKLAQQHNYDFHIEKISNFIETL